MTTAEAPITVELSRRQYEVLLLKLRGFSARQIAERLSVDCTTVHNTTVRAYDRIREAGVLPGVASRQFLQQLTVAVMAGQVRFAKIPYRSLFPRG